MRPSYLVVPLTILLTACQSGPPHLSVDEAKKVSADFGGAGFVPPPRTIADITAILDEQKPNAPFRAALMGRLNNPPNDTSDAGLAIYYNARADAALNLGMPEQAVAYARDSVRHARLANRGLAVSLLVLGACQFYADGSGTDSWRESYEVAHANDQRGLVVSGARNLTESATYNGDIAAARRYVADSDQTVYRIQGVAAFRFAGYLADNAEAHALLETALGKFADAETWQRKAVAQWRIFADAFSTQASWNDTTVSIGGIQRHYAALVIGLAQILMAQGRTVEAEAVARDALLYSLGYTGRGSPGAAMAADNLAQVLFVQGRFADAERLFSAGLEIRQTLGIPDENGRNWTANSIAMQQRWIEAVSLYDDTKRIRTVGDPYAVDPRIIALYHVNRVDEGLALARILTDQRVRAFGQDSRDTAIAKGFVATGLALRGEGSAALSSFREILPQLSGSKHVREHSEDQGTPSREYLVYVLESYLRVLFGANDGSKTDMDAVEGFAVADILRVAATDRAVAASVARATLRSPELADLARREQDAQQQIRARQATLTNVLSRPVDQQNAIALATLRGEIDQLEQARAAFTQEIEKRFPDYANLVNPSPASIEQARAVLTNDEALVALYAGEKESYVWALRKAGPVTFAVIPLGRGQLADMVAQLRHALEPNASTLGEIPPFDVALAYKLYAAILQPVEAGWKGAKTLIMALHGPLGQVPFSLLVTRPVGQPQDRAALFSGYQEVPYLVREVAVTQVPSVAALAILRGMPPANPGRRAFVGFGDPWFSAQQAAEARREQAPAQVATLATRAMHFRAAPATETMASATLSALPRLPDTAVEVREIAATLQANPATDVFLGAAANERQVRTMKLDDRRVIMFATHGLVPGDLDGLAQPALALSAPSVAGVEGDGLLTMEKILGLKLDVDWVVLSACNTAAGDGAGAEAVSGLGRAFFYAGARALLVTNWPVETTSARTLTTAVFRAQADNSSLSRGDALRSAMLSLIDGPGAIDRVSGRVLYSYAHPIFWAPFSLVGDGG